MLDGSWLCAVVQHKDTGRKEEEEEKKNLFQFTRNPGGRETCFDCYIIGVCFPSSYLFLTAIYISKGGGELMDLSDGVNEGGGNTRTASLL